MINTLKNLRGLHHQNCVVCGAASKEGLGLRFEVNDHREVVAAFDCGALFQGYPSVLHGGVISSLLDGAMTNCLFAHGHVAVTAELRVRFRHPVTTDRPATVRAWVVESRPFFHLVKAELTQDDQIKARAEGKFVNRSED